MNSGTFNVGDSHHLGTGKDRIVCAGMPRADVFSVVQVKWEFVYRGNSWDLFFPKSDQQIRIDGVNPCTSGASGPPRSRSAAERTVGGGRCRLRQAGSPQPRRSSPRRSSDDPRFRSALMQPAPHRITLEDELRTSASPSPARGVGARVHDRLQRA